MSDDKKRRSIPPFRSAPPPPLITSGQYEVMAAARRLVEGALGVVRGERVVLVGDRERKELVDALQHVSLDIGAVPVAFLLEDLGVRPLSALPKAIGDALDEAQASALLCGYAEGELPMRMALAGRANERKLRHAHMVGLSAKSLVPGFAVDPGRVLGATYGVRARLAPSASLRIRSRAGTDLRVRLDPATRFWECTGVVRPGRWQNFPSGRLSTCPAEVSGVFVADASVAERFGAEAGLLRDKPVRVEIEGGALKSVACSDAELRRAIERYLRSGANGTRIGMVHIGTNVGLLEAVGEIICDLNLPGVHIGFGSPFPGVTGATWDSPVQLAMAGLGHDVDCDGTAILRSGRYLIV